MGLPVQREPGGGVGMPPYPLMVVRATDWAPLAPTDPSERARFVRLRNSFLLPHKRPQSPWLTGLPSIAEKPL